MPWRDAEVKVKRLVSDDAWDYVWSPWLLVSRITAAFLEKAWGVRNACRHYDAVLLPVQQQCRSIEARIGIGTGLKAQSYVGP